MNVAQHDRLDFKRIAEYWRALPLIPASPAVADSDDRRLLFRHLTDSERRGWFSACYAWMTGGPSPDDYSEIRQLLDYFGDYKRRIAEAHLDCAQGVAPSLIAAQRKISPALLQELARELQQGQERELQGESLKVICPLVWARNNGNGKEDGEIVQFVFDRLPAGERECFPAPAQAFIPLDDDFARIFDTAPVAVHKLFRGGLAHGFDVCVRFEPLTADWLPEIPPLEGPSAGGALALGLAKCLTTNGLLKAVSLAGVIISAEVDKSGDLRSVGDIATKIGIILK